MSYDERPLYLVVGAGPGMGLACAARFAQHGWQTVLLGHEAAFVESVADQLADLHPDAPRAITAVVEATDPAAVKSTIESLNLERVDVAHYNVSTWVPGALDSDLAEVTAGLNAGAVSALAMVQAVVPAMAGGGAIMFTGSGAADMPAKASLGLGMQKAALRNLAIGLHKVLGVQGIRVVHLTIYGALAPDSPFSPSTISARFAELVLDADTGVVRPFEPGESWDPVVAYHGT